MFRFLELSADERAAMGAAGRDKMEREYDEAHVISAYRTAIQPMISTRSARQTEQAIV
jgi:hypothetical protein